MIKYTKLFISMKSLKEFLNESLKLKNNVLEWDPSSKGIMKSSFGKTKKLEPYVTTLKTTKGPVKAYSMFKRGDEITPEILKAIKKRSSEISIDDVAYSNLVNRGAIYINKILKSINPDVIITPQSSSSFNNDILNRYREMNPSIKMFFGAIYKNPNLHELKFDNVKGFNEKTVANQENDLLKFAKAGEFQMKKVHPKFRPYIRNWLKLDPSIEKHVINKNIVIFDDYLTSGASLMESANQLFDAGADTVTAITYLHKL